MNDLTPEVLVFRTNVKTQKAIEKIKPLLDGHLAISKWNFDLEDCDKILRIEASAKNLESNNQTLAKQGFLNVRNYRMNYKIGKTDNLIMWILPKF